jgi:hypothetical protein
VRNKFRCIYRENILYYLSEGKGLRLGGNVESEQYRMLLKHEQDLYRGNGLPGLTTRVLTLENAMKSIQFYGRWLLIFLGGILLTAIANLVVKK